MMDMETPHAGKGVVIIRIWGGGGGGGYDENGKYTFTTKTVDGVVINVTTYENGAKYEEKYPVGGGVLKKTWIVPLPTKPWWKFW